jgi:ABC-2 type transport system ATP-binding protein
MVFKKNRYPIIEVEYLEKKYKNTDAKAVSELSFTINRGEIFGLLGPNGAGKTTTINILTGQLAPSAGVVRISGKNIQNDFNDIKKRIGIVPQDISLYPTLSVLNNLRIFGNLYGLHGNKLKQAIEKNLRVFGLEKKITQKVKTLSGGMKRRLNIIAGILHSPEIIILDEPTAGIDVQSKKFILENLEELNNNGATILYTSHYMDEAEKFCTEIAILDEGKIIANEKPEELVKSHGDCKSLEDVFIKLTGKQIRE